VPVLTVLGIDPAMDNVGYHFLKLNTSEPPHLPGPPIPFKDPLWITEKDPTGKHTYWYFQSLAGGTKQSDSTRSMTYRLINQADEVHKLIAELKPDILVLEAQLDKGDNKNPYGVALQIAITFPYFHPTTRPPTIRPAYHPRWVIQIRPERLQSIAHHQRKTTGREVVQRFKHVTECKARVSQHEADAYFLAVHGGRFWASCVKSHWDRDILTSKENHVFLQEPKGMLFQMDDAWWENQEIII
jgi:hypothetical protein